MSAFDLGDDNNPISLVESLADQYDWNFERMSNGQIALEMASQWQTYSITLAWSADDETLRMVCAIAMATTRGKTAETIPYVKPGERPMLVWIFYLLARAKTDGVSIRFGSRRRPDSQPRTNRTYDRFCGSHF